MPVPAIGVVVVSRNEGPNLARTVGNLDRTLPSGSRIVVVDDASGDGSARLIARRGRIIVLRAGGIGVARARNLGASRCPGEVLVFADAHIAAPPFWWRPLLELVERPGVGAAAPAICGFRSPAKAGYGLTFRGPALEVRWLRRKPAGPAPVPILPGCCFAIRRDIYTACGGWDEGLVRRGSVDNEFCLRLWLSGYDLVVTPECTVSHLFRAVSPYPVSWAGYLHNRLRLAFVHFGADRVAKVVAALRRTRGFGEALLLVAGSDAAARRRQLLATRVRDDDWFFGRFHLQW